MAPKAVAKPRQLRAASTQAPLSNLETSADKHATTLAHGGAKGDRGGSLAAAGPLSYSQAVESILTRVSNGASARAAAIAAGIPEQTWYSWMTAARTGAWPDGSEVASPMLTFARDLRERVARAESEVEAQCQETLLTASKVSVGTLDWRAAHEHLKHAEATRTRWKEHRELKIEHAGQVGHEHRLVAQLPMAEVVDLLPDEWRDLVPPLAISGTSEGQ